MVTNLYERKKKLRKELISTKQKLIEIKKIKKKLTSDLRNNIITKREYNLKINQVFKQRSYEDWIKYYNDWKLSCRKEIS